MDDNSLIQAVLPLLADYGVKEAGELVGVSHETVARWRRGEFTRLHPKTRRQLQAFLDRQKSSKISRETSPTGTRGDRVDQLFDLLSNPEMLRRMAGRVSRRDIAAALVQTGIDDGFSAEEMERVFSRAQELIAEDEAERS